MHLNYVILLKKYNQIYNIIRNMKRLLDKEDKNHPHLIQLPCLIMKKFLLDRDVKIICRKSKSISSIYIQIRL